jgi:hypothetical protein
MRGRKTNNEDDHDLDFNNPLRRRLMEDREPGWDCVSQMRLARSRPEVLANALLAMGITESGDEMPDYQERTE